MPDQNNARLLLDFHGSDDAGVFRTGENSALVQTIDFFTPIVDDPETFGAISAANALSDTYAMGAQPLTALGVVCYPYRQLDPEILAAICSGGARKIAESGAVILGGHSVEDAEIKFGYAITATVDADKFWRNNTPERGDTLVLTKPLGTGLLTTAVKQQHLPEAVLEAPIMAMKSLNKVACEVARSFDIHAATDVTGFGLWGHLFEMVRHRGLGATLTPDALPLFDGVWEAIAAGALTRANRTNLEYIGSYAPKADVATSKFSPLVLDPQTSGGLLFALPAPQADALVEQLNAHQVNARAIGSITTEARFTWG